MSRIKIHDLPLNYTLSTEDMRNVSGGMITSVSGGSISVFAFQDICTTPSPAGPIPIPYPNIGMTSGTSTGTSNVKCDGGQVTATGGNYLSSSGDEPGTE